MRICFILPSLCNGGAERVTLKIVDYIKTLNIQCTLIVLDCSGQLRGIVPDGVELRCLNAHHARSGILQLFTEMRRIAPDIVFSTIGHINILISVMSFFLVRKPKLIVRESSVMSKKHPKNLLFRFWMIMYSIAYRKVHTVICQSEFMRNDLLRVIRVDSSKLTIINNPVERNKIVPHTIPYWDRLPESTLKLLAVGRLEKVKRFELLLDIVSKVVRPFMLIILGEGRERPHLEQLISDRGLGDRVKLPGYDSDPYSYYQAADVLLMTSAYEGFPNVVLEANVYGTPVLAFNVPGGLCEIVENDINGILIDDDKIDLFVGEIQTWERARFDKGIISDRISSRFSYDEIMKKYEAVFVGEDYHAKK